MEHPVLVSGHASGAIRFWKLVPKELAKACAQAGDAAGGGCARGKQDEEKLALQIMLSCTRSHAAAVTSIAFSADGHQMLTGDAQGIVNLWGRDRGSRAGHEPKWLAAAPRLDGRLVRLDERILQCMLVEPVRVERSEADGGKLVGDFGGPTQVFVMACCLAGRARPACSSEGPQQPGPTQDPVAAPSDIKWETRRTFAQFAELHVLLQRHGGVTTAMLPPKKPTAFMTGHTEDHSADLERQQGLASFLTECLRQCTARQAAILCAFVQAPSTLHALSEALPSQDA